MIQENIGFYYANFNATPHVRSRRRRFLNFLPTVYTSFETDKNLLNTHHEFHEFVLLQSVYSVYSVILFKLILDYTLFSIGFWV